MDIIHRHENILTTHDYTVKHIMELTRKERWTFERFFFLFETYPQVYIYRWLADRERNASRYGDQRRRKIGLPKERHGKLARVYKKVE